MNGSSIQLIIVLFFLTISFSFGQSSMGIEVCGGFGKASNSFKLGNGSIKTPFYPNWKAGLFYTYNFKKPYSVSTGLSFSRLSSKEIWNGELTVTDINGNFLRNEYYQNTINKKVTYLVIPIYFELSVNKLTAKLGVQGGIMLFSSGSEAGWVTYNGTLMSTNEQYDKLSIDWYDYGVTAEMNFRLNKTISFSGNYYHGINNVLSENALWKSHNQQITLGVQYYLLNKNTKLN